MLQMLTHKLRSQSLNEMQPYYPDEVLNDEDRDSGTESDDENLGAVTDPEASGDPGETSDDSEAGPKSVTAAFPPLRPVLVPSLKRPLQLVSQRTAPVKRPSSPTSSPSSSPLLGRKYDSDFDRCSLGYETTSSVEFDPHSSEDELSVINCREKRTWSQRRGSCCSTGDSAGSSDEEVRDLLAGDLQTTGVAAGAPSRPLLFSSSPPKGVQHLNHRTVYACMQQRKRHRHIGSRDVSDATCIQRPCLDFDKMQVSACAPLICFY